MSEEQKNPAVSSILFFFVPVIVIGNAAYILYLFPLSLITPLSWQDMLSLDSQHPVSIVLYMFFFYGASKAYAAARVYPPEKKFEAIIKGLFLVPILPFISVKTDKKSPIV